jgi:hypothetical protein
MHVIVDKIARKFGLAQKSVAPRACGSKRSFAGLFSVILGRGLTAGLAEIARQSPHDAARSYRRISPCDGERVHCYWL